MKMSPFDDIEAEEKLHDLVDVSECNSPVEEYINGEDDIPICIHMTGKIAFLLNLVHLKQILLKMITMKKNSLTLSTLLKKLQSFKMQSLLLKRFNHSWTVKDMRKRQQKNHHL